jgi:hypothetical protein
MGVFDDKKLEQLDWMSQMTETIDSHLNVLLAQLPDRIAVTANDIIEYGGYSYIYLRVKSVLDPVIKTTTMAGNMLDPISWSEQELIYNCFKIETQGNIEIDLRTRQMVGEVFVVKTIQTLSDEDLLPYMGGKGIESVGERRDWSDGWHSKELSRMNEVLDILGNCSESIRGRSVRNKLSSIKTRLRTIFTTNEWRIRDMALADKVGFWINGYINNGNLADLTNLCKLKVMTHSNMPIYSVKEEV